MSRADDYRAPRVWRDRAGRWVWSFVGRWRNSKGKRVHGTIASGPTFASDVLAVAALRRRLGNASAAVEIVGDP